MSMRRCGVAEMRRCGIVTSVEMRNFQSELMEKTNVIQIKRRKK